MLLEGLDEIGITLRHSSDIDAFERKRFEQEPWLLSGVGL
jgi:3-isopropylmalate/(R)-2-methylmalate dehydratase small subunit